MSDGRPAVVLVMDDDESVRRSIRNYLEDQDYDILEAENGRVGLEIFERRRPDLALVDLRMPEVDGREVLARITEQSPDTPLIVVSGTGVIADAVDALHKGAWDYVLKPIEDMSVLLHAVQRGLERTRLIRENRAYQHRLEELVEKRTEALRRTNVELREGEQRYRLLTENQKDVVLKISPNGKLLYCSPAVREFGGYEPQEVIGKDLSEYLANEADVARARGLLVRAAADKQAAMAEFLYQPKSADPFPIEVTAKPIVESGRMVALQCVMRDVTERKQADQERRELEARVLHAQKLESLGVLAGGIAHDFNNILAAIVGFGDLAAQATTDNASVQESLGQVSKAAGRAKELVDQILTFSRPDVQQRAPTRVQTVAKEALKLLGVSLPATIEIRTNIDEKCRPVLADAAQLHQIIMNLSTNAYQAMRERTGVLTLEVAHATVDTETAHRDASLEPGEYVRLSVADTGEGMDRATMARAFEPYFTTKERGEGTGLGLATVHGIVKSHGGEITVDSKPGAGTRFDVFLPVLHEDVREPRPEDDPQPPPGGSESILFADDEESMVLMAELTLGRLGYKVTGCRNGAEALEAFRADPESFDLVITDQTMPKMTGASLAGELLRIRADLPIILCTGFSETVSEEQAKDVGVREYLKKPFRPDDLARAVRRALGHTADGNAI